MTLTLIELGRLLGPIESDDERVDTLLRHVGLLIPTQGQPIELHIQAVLDLPPDELRRGALARALSIIVYNGIVSSDGRGMVEIGDRSVVLYRELGDRDGEACVLYHLSSLFWRQSRFSEALETLSRSMELWRDDGNISAVAGALNKMSMIHTDLGEYKIALRMLNEALAISEAVGQPLMVARDLNSLGVVFGALGILDRALDYYQRSLAIRKEQQFGTRDVALSLVNVGSMYLRIRDFERAGSFLQQGLKLSRQAGLRSSESKALHNLALGYMRVNDPINALAYYKESLAIKEEIGDRAGAASTMNGIALTYTELGDYGEALRYAMRGLEIYEGLGLPGGLVASLFRVGSIQGRQGDHAAAVETFGRILDIDREPGAEGDTSQAHHLLADMLKQRGDYRGAIEHYEEHIRLDRKIYSEETNRRLRNMTIAYEVEQMEKEAKILRLSNERLEQEAEFKKKELTSTAMYLTQKNEFLRKLRRRVEEISRDAMQPEVTGSLRSVMREIGEAVESEQHWSTFEKQFHQVHAGYLEVLAERYPKLTPTELKVCALIKINVSTKEIAQILNTEPRSIEKYRQRIRRKLELAQEENLGAFLTALGRHREAPVPVVSD